MFSDQSHLSRWFKRCYELTPAAYRKSAQIFKIKILIISSCLSQLTKVDKMENLTAFSLFAIVASITQARPTL